MPYAYIVIAIVLLVAAMLTMAAFIVIIWRRQRRLRKAVAQAIRDDAESERRIRELLGAEELRVVNGNAGRHRPPRHLRLLPAVTAISAVVWAWIRTHPVLIAGTVAGLAAVTLFVVAGSSSSNRAMQERLVPGPAITTTVAPRVPSSTSELPPLTTTTMPTATAETPPTPDGVAPIVTSVPVLPTSTTTVTATSTVPHSTSRPGPPPTVPPTPCLLRVTLNPVADVCL